MKLRGPRDPDPNPNTSMEAQRMDYSIEITNSNGDVFYNTTDAVRIDQANGWPNIDPALRRALARRGLDSLDLDTALAMLADATAEGDLQETLRGINGDTYARLIRRGLDHHITELASKADTNDFELLVGGLIIRVTYEPEDIVTLDDAIGYVMRDPATPAIIRYALGRPEIVGQVKAYFEYVAWNEHGNQPSYAEMAEDGGIASVVSDLVLEPDHTITQYLTGGMDADNGMMYDAEACRLLINRAAIQHLYGVEPDWSLWE